MKKNRYKIFFLIIVVFCFSLLKPYVFLNAEDFAKTPKIDSLVFVIVRHVENESQDLLWKRCYDSIRQFYVDTPIVIIDNASKIKISNSDLTQTSIIDSEYPSAGELTPYYYYLRYKWAEKMIFLHDSMFLKRPFSKEELSHSVKFHWDFDSDHYSDNALINNLLSHLRNSDELIDYNLCHKSSWKGCFGATSLINLSALEIIEDKYLLSSLVTVIKNRDDRCALERVFGILIFKGGFVKKENCSNFGSILDYPFYYQRCDPMHLEYIKSTYPGAVIKTWHSRN